MSDGSLSQDEIDALLQGSGGFDLGGDEAPAAGPTPPAAQGPNMGAFTEFINGIASSQASNLTSLIGTDAKVGEPTVEIITNGTFVESLPAQVVQTVLNLSGGTPGQHSYLFSPELATTVAGLMMGQEGIELNDAALNALQEAGNTLAGAAATAMTESLGVDVSTEPGETNTKEAGEVAVPPGEFAKVTYPVTIEGNEPSELIELFDIAILNHFGGGGGGDALGSDTVDDSLFGGGDIDEQSLFGGALGDAGGGMALGGQSNPNVQAVQFPSLGGGVPVADQGNIGLLMDVYMEMTVELGRTRRLIRDILGMGEGTILELDKLAGEPVDILVNQKLIAKGEVVVIDENFGVRVTEIVDPMERVSEM